MRFHKCFIDWELQEARDKRQEQTRAGLSASQAMKSWPENRLDTVHTLQSVCKYICTLYCTLYLCVFLYMCTVYIQQMVPCRWQSLPSTSYLVTAPLPIAYLVSHGQKLFIQLERNYIKLKQ